MLSKQKGDIALGKAISHFISNGYEVCLPIGDKRDYDMVVEKDGVLSRIQVKYGGLYKNQSKCVVALRVMGGNQSYFTAKKYAPNAFEYLFVHTAKGDSYFLPWKDNINSKSSLGIESERYNEYKLNMQG